MHEKEPIQESSLRSLRSIFPEEPVFVRNELLDEGEAAVIGSLYLGNAVNAANREKLDEGGQRLDIVDLRSAPLTEKGRKYAGQIFSTSVDYLVIQGQPDWRNGKGFKGIRSGESLTIGRKDAVSSKRFDLGNPEISRHHATITNVDGLLAIEDNGSTNGTMYAAYNREHLPPLEEIATDVVTEPVAPEHTARTESDLARVIDQKEVASWNGYMKETRELQYGSVQELIDRSSLAPATGVQIDNKTFLLSKVVKSAGRKVAIGYVSSGEQSGRLMPRLFYQSMSDGGWRSAPNIGRDGVLSKGIEQLGVRMSDEYGHYVQVTKPSEDIVAVLERQDRLQNSDKDDAAGYDFIDYSDLMYLYDEQLIDAEAHSTFADEVNVTKVEGRFMDSYISGVGARDGEVMREQLAAMELPAGFEPDFSLEPSKVYRTDHTIAGMTTIEVYPAILKGRTIEWHVAHDETHNRVWVDRIAFADGEVTTYGTQREVIVAGALSSKPFDYTEQLWGMRESRDWERVDRRYADVTPTLDCIPAIKHYRQSRGVYRK